ncbi:MAG: MATE family efflux transporter [Endomicrobium sp.]|jgi:O-antigen/teichoic acid export membrane protein|nr:MATE family efflux transporter [Endomicrobium sp.]
MEFKSKHSRTLNIQKNVLISFGLKGISMGISLLLVPLTLNYLDKERYGLWLTLSSIISWFSLFDIGLGNGFRNKFAEAIAVKNEKLAKTYVSTTFLLLSIIIGVVLAAFLIINPFLDWRGILNTSIESRHTLSLLAIIIFTFFALQFIFKLTTSVFLADQKSALVDLIGVLGSLLSLIIIFFLMQIGERSLLFLGCALSASPVFVLVIAYFIAFTGKYAKYRPSLKCIDLKQSKDLMGLGFLFFIPQICSLIVFSTSNLIITQLFTPSDVTVYNIAYKYFSLVIVFFQIIVNPFWSAFTEAFVKQDYHWIKNVMRRLVLLWLVFCLGSLFLVVISGFAYHIWVGDTIYIPLQLSIGLAIYMCVSNWNSIFVSFTAGVSKIFIQVWLSLTAGAVFVPLAIIISKRAGLIGVPLAMALSIFPGSIISPVQYNKLVNGKALGFWNK